MPFQQKYQITQRHLPTPSKRRSGLPLSPGPKFVVVHDTGNPGSTAAQNVAHYTSTANGPVSASAHLFVDDTEIIECVPALTGAPEKAWHVLYGVPTDNQLFGYNANDAAIAVEYCYGPRINADEAYRKYVWVIAQACYAFQMDPAKAIVGHYILDPHRRTDPVTGLAHSRRTYEQLLRDIVAEYADCAGQAPPAPPPPPNAGQVTARVRLNIRAGAPSVRARVHQTVAVGTQLDYVAIVSNGDPVNGNSVWYRDAAGNYFWSGGVLQL
jgi:N-acetylmuramoyl-L-alanine amidase